MKKLAVLSFFGIFAIFLIRVAHAQNTTQKSFHYQLQGANYEALRTLDSDYFVIDPDDAQLEKNQVQDLQDNGHGVLAYLSIGEAENYRDYWKSNWRRGSPAFLDDENPSWPGNYKVKYWHPAWQKIILARVRAIASLGYSGVYLDIIDAYEYYQDHGRKTAAKDMVQFVARIRKAARAVNPHFLIVPQNSPELYRFKAYRPLIDGIGKEDTWFNDNTPQDAGQIASNSHWMDKMISDGKFVLAIDYPTQSDLICAFYERCESHAGYACTVSNRDLDLNQPLRCGDSGATPEPDAGTDYDSESP